MKHSALVLAVMSGVARMLIPGSAHGIETCQFERLWPALEQSWYHVDGLGNHAAGLAAPPMELER